MEINYSEKVCVHDIVIAVLNSNKLKYLSSATSKSGDLIGDVCMLCHDSERSNCFEIPKLFNINDVGYVRASFPEMTVLKENANIKIKVDDEGQVLTHSSVNMFPFGRSF